MGNHQLQEQPVELGTGGRCQSVHLLAGRLLIADAILLVLRTATGDVFRRLMDAVDPAIVDIAERTLLQTPGVQAIRQLRIRWLGHTLQTEADLDVDPDLTLTQSHQIAHDAEADLLGHVQRLTTVLIHTSPAGAHQLSHS